MLFEQTMWRGLAARLVRLGLPPYFAMQIAAACYPHGATKAMQGTGFNFASPIVSPQQAALAVTRFEAAGPKGVPELFVPLLVILFGQKRVEQWREELLEADAEAAADAKGQQLEAQYEAALRELGLPPTALLVEVQKQYLSLCKQFHPDRNQHESAEIQAKCHAKMASINKAYEVAVAWLAVAKTAPSGCRSTSADRNAENATGPGPTPATPSAQQTASASPDSYRPNQTTPVGKESPQAANDDDRPSKGEKGTDSQVRAKRRSNQTAINATLWSATAITAVVVLGIAFAAVNQQISYQPKPQGKDDVVVKRKRREKGPVPTSPSQREKKTKRAPSPDFPDPFGDHVNEKAGEPPAVDRPAPVPHFVPSESSLRSAMQEASYLLDAGRPSQAVALLRPFTAKSRPQYVKTSGLWSDFLVLQHNCNRDRSRQLVGRVSPDDSMRSLWETALSKQRLMNHWFDIGMASEAEGVFWEADAAYEHLAERCQALPVSAAGNSRTQYSLEAVSAQRATLHTERDQRLSEVGRR